MAKDLYGLKIQGTSWYIPQVSNGKLGLISPDKVKEIDNALANLKKQINTVKLMLSDIKSEEVKTDLNFVTMDELNEILKSFMKNPSIVDGIDEATDDQKVYFVKKDNTEDSSNQYDEFVVLNGVPEQIGESESITQDELVEVISHFE